MQSSWLNLLFPNTRLYIVFAAGIFPWLMQASLFSRPSTPLASLLVTCLLAFSGCEKKVSGTYTGTCHNATYDKTGTLTLILNQDQDRVSGNLTISGELTGGGVIDGRIDGDTISFITTEPLIGQLAWVGRIKNHEIEGTYIVETRLATTLLTGTTSQEGTWKVARPN